MEPSHQQHGNRREFGKRRQLLKTVPSRATGLENLDNHVLNNESNVCSVSLYEHAECMKVQVKILAGIVTAETTAMIDSGATNNFINESFIKKNFIRTKPKQIPLTVKDIAGRKLGMVDKQVTVKIRMANHEEEITLNIIRTGKHPVVLGLPWLKTHNPTIDWRENRIIFTHFFCANNCLDLAPDVFTEGTEIPEMTDKEADNFCVNAEISKADAKTTFSIAIGRKNIEEEKTFEELVPEAYHDFKDIFSEEVATKLPPSREHDLAIKFKEGTKLPKPAGIYPMSDAELKDLREWTDEMLKKGFIQPSKSQVASPCFYVPKKDSMVNRMVVDYRNINDITEKDQFPIPRTDEIVDRVRGAEIFSKFDLRWGYNLLRIKPGDEWKTAFRTRYGLFEFKVMPFGLSNAPAAFQRMMNDVLSPVLDTSAINYLDDTTTYNKTLEEHIPNNRLVLSRFREFSLFCRLHKCKLHKEEVEFLGMKLSKYGMKMDEHKVEAITEWPMPKNVTNIREFLGFCNFYRRFVDNFAKIARPLHDLEKKDTKFQMTEERIEAFNKIKEAIASAPVLAHADPDKPYILETDASNYAYGAVLSQKQEDNKIHPIAFLSKSMTPAEKNYDIYDKEMLTVVKALQHWRQYLERSNHPINIITDHKNLEYWKEPRSLNQRQIRWLDLLQHYNFKITYRPGHESGKPDALSRRHDHREEGGVEIPRTLLKEEQFSELCEIYASDATIIEAIKEYVETDEALKPVLAFLRAGHDQATAEVKEAMEDYKLEDGIVYRKDKIYVPANEEVKQRILELYHDSTVAGHPGQAKTLELMSRGYYWPSMKAYVNRYVGACDKCQRNKQRHSRLQGSLKPLPVPEGPWQSMSCDFIVELPKSNGYDTILVVVDRLTKMAHFIPTTVNVDARQTAQLLMDNVWKLHGTPRDIVSDRGPQFASKVTRSLFNLIGIQSNLSTAYHPQTDGQMERVNGILEQYLRIFSSHRQDDWAKLLPLAEFAYNNAEHASTGMSPFFATYGFHPTLTTHPSRGQQSQ